MKKIILLGLFVSATLISCNKKTTTTSESDSVNDTMATDTTMIDAEHTSQNALDWAGTYETILPCADCEGIKTTITLNSDETFKYVAEYINKEQKIEAEGKIMWHNDGAVIHLKATDVDTKLKVIENGLLYLDQDGNEIDGALKEHYQFKKID